MTSTDPIQRALSRFKDVKKIMEEAAKVRTEFHALESFLRQAHDLFPDSVPWPLPEIDAGVDASSPGAPAVQVKPSASTRTSDFAEWVLKVHGPLHIRNIMRIMRSEGWPANKDDDKAEKTLFNVMATHKDRFRNQGKNIWEVSSK